MISMFKVKAKNYIQWHNPIQKPLLSFFKKLMKKEA